jgi:hypothetical protein
MGWRRRNAMTSCFAISDLTPGCESSGREPDDSSISVDVLRFDIVTT